MVFSIFLGQLKKLKDWEMSTLLYNICHFNKKQKSNMTNQKVLCPSINLKIEERTVSFFILIFGWRTEIRPLSHLRIKKEWQSIMTKWPYFKTKNIKRQLKKAKCLYCIDYGLRYGLNFQNWRKQNAFTLFLFDLGTEIWTLCHLRGAMSTRTNHQEWEYGLI